MKDLNQIVIEGRLTKDSEFRKTLKGKPVQTFSIAVGDDYKPKDSVEWIKRAYFFNCVFFGEIDGLTKGVHIIINGKLTTSKLETDTGLKTYTQIEVQGLKFVKDKEKDETQEIFVKTKDIKEDIQIPF